MREINENTNRPLAHEPHLPKVESTPHAIPAQHKSRPQHMADAFAGAAIHEFPGNYFEPGEPQ